MRDVTARVDLVTPHTFDPLDVEFVRDQHLRSPNGTAEDDFIAQLIAASLNEAENDTQRTILTCTKKLVLDGFPCGAIEIPFPPIQSVESITYVDEDGVTQTWDDSEYHTSIPYGPTAGRARIRPAYGLTYPTARCQMDAVTVTFVAGYVDTSSPPVPDVPAEITQGRLLLIGELYKQRSLSVHAFNQFDAVIRARALFARYRVY